MRISMHAEIVNVPNQIRRLRVERGWSQVRLSVKARLSLPTVAIAERTGCFTARTARRLARALGVAPEDLRRPAPPSP